MYLRGIKLANFLTCFFLRSPIKCYLFQRFFCTFHCIALHQAPHQGTTSHRIMICTMIVYIYRLNTSCARARQQALYSTPHNPVTKNKEGASPFKGLPPTKAVKTITCFHWINVSNCLAKKLLF